MFFSAGLRLNARLWRGSRLVAVALSLSTASIGCSYHEGVPPGGHREWGACSAVGATAGGLVGAGLGIAISMSIVGPHKKNVIVAGDPATIPFPGGLPLPPIPNPACITTPSACQPHITKVNAGSNNNEWLGALGAIPGGLAGA